MTTPTEGKGFGCITPDNGGKAVFVHLRDIKGTGFMTSTEAQRMEFKVTQGLKGTQASDIWPA
jgi:CspA family cold shock protein